MKVKGVKVVEGVLSIEGKKKLCPFASQAGTNTQIACGDWCALFTVERPSNDRVKVSLNCSAGTAYESY